MDTTLIIRNGRLLRGGVEVRPQIGNPEHIAVVKAANRKYAQLFEWFNVTIDDRESDYHEDKSHYTADFECICGCNVAVLDVDNADPDYWPDVEWDKCQCRQCGQKYRVVRQCDDELIIKAI